MPETQLHGPKPGGAEPVAPMSKARAAVLERLRSSDGTINVEELAVATGQHSNTVREHLEALVANGFATRTTSVSTGRGRPAWRYAPAIAETSPRGYAALAAALAAQIAATSEKPAAAGELAGRRWAHALQDTPAISTHSATVDRAFRARVAAELAEAGFGIQGNAAATDFTLTTCPILGAARENPEVVCAVHLGLVKGLMEGSGMAEDDVELVPFAGPGACTLHLPSVPAT
ncbi:helix-turn-helix transcriptional regulator [Arthrobacter cryoconiti]|uniref:Helix-turn-helix transcriptional regulator n=1 Tax=Arthrobacter cryoconiti TaxID=748907 RepID=A0ABV8QYT2_9MICC|nr:helix-turn-helix domain-containing protein [Arthrobacter cryoconiti]MCC9067533.1 helix-turn-helix domain-containing protein [Arthrobacter cryoconiti]